MQGIRVPLQSQKLSVQNEYELKQIASEVELMMNALQEDAERVSKKSKWQYLKKLKQLPKCLEMGLDLILAGGVLYVSPKLDVSAELIAKMNTKYGSKKRQEQKSAPVMQPLPMKDLPK